MKRPVRLKQADYQRNIWTSTPDAGVPLEDVLKPEFWSHIARKLRIGDRIEIVPEDTAYFAELYVADVGMNRVTMKVLRNVPFNGEGSEDTDNLKGDDNDSDYYIKWRGNNKRFCIMRKSDDVTMKEGIQTKEEARAESLRLDLGTIS